MFQLSRCFYFFPGKGNLLKLLPAVSVSVSRWPAAGPEQSLDVWMFLYCFSSVHLCTLLLFIIINCMWNLAASAYKASLWGLMQCNCSLIFLSQGLVQALCGGLWEIPWMHLAFWGAGALSIRSCPLVLLLLCVGRDCQQRSRRCKTRDPLGPEGWPAAPRRWCGDRPALGLAAGRVPVPGCHHVLSGIEMSVKNLGGAGSLATPSMASAFLGKGVSFPGAVPRLEGWGWRWAPLALFPQGPYFHLEVEGR